MAVWRLFFHVVVNEKCTAERSRMMKDLGQAEKTWVGGESRKKTDFVALAWGGVGGGISEKN